MIYDLLIKGGHVLDPATGLDRRVDIGICAGRIAALDAELPISEARRVLDGRGASRYVLPGLINLHTHVAYGASTKGVGLEWGHPDIGGVASGVTTEIDAGSTGIANVGVFPAHILPHAQTRIICYLNVGSLGCFTLPGRPDVARFDDVDPHAIADCIEHNPGLISGIKVRVIGPLMNERGEDLIRLAKKIAREHTLPLMAHIGDPGADPQRWQVITRFLLKTLEPGDILTHYSTPHPGTVMDSALRALPGLREARAAGVVLDSCTGRKLNHFGFETARRQAELGLHPDTISTDSVGRGRTMIFSLLQVMGMYMALGYTLADVVRMTTANPARACGQAQELGAIAVGREADLTVVDVVTGRWKFVGESESVIGEHALVPVQTVRAGALFAPDWGPYPWGWLPPEA